MLKIVLDLSVISLTVLTGKGPQCPPSTNKPNKTVCNEEFVCYMGVSITVWLFYS